MGHIKDLTGQRFGRLEVLRFYGTDEGGQARWECRCDCGNVRDFAATHLKRGSTKSCGCYQRELAAKRRREGRKRNSYRIVGDIAYVKLSNRDEEFICDLADWEKAREYTWNKTTHGYVRTSITLENGKRKEIRFHGLVMNPAEGMLVDHIDGDKLNNRRSNLRLVAPLVNLQNRHTTRGKTGIIGVRQFPSGRYGAQVKTGGQTFYLGRFDTLEEAAAARRRKEIELNYAQRNEYLEGEY